MIIRGFWHIYMINHWYSIVSDQLRILLSSGLYDNSETINIGCVGSKKERMFLQKCFIDIYPKLKVKYYLGDPLVYEFPTIQLIENWPGNYYGYYFHTKGVTRPFDSVINHWRAWQNEAILNRWRFNYKNIHEGYDISGVNFCASPDHYSGNFWWFNREYIDKLPKIADLDHKNRFHAEQWNFMCKDVVAFKGEFVEASRDVFKMKINP